MKKNWKRLYICSLIILLFFILIKPDKAKSSEDYPPCVNGTGQVTGVCTDDVGPWNSMTSQWNYGATSLVEKFILLGGRHDGDQEGWTAHEFKFTNDTQTSKTSVMVGIGEGNTGNVAYDSVNDKYITVVSDLRPISPAFDQDGVINGDILNASGLGGGVGFWIGTTGSGERFTCRPAVYSNGDKFLVVWEERRAVNGHDYKNCDGERGRADGGYDESFLEFVETSIIYGAFVDINGTVGTQFVISDPSPGIISVFPQVSSTYIDGQTPAEIAANDFLVTWSTYVDAESLPESFSGGCDPGNPNGLDSDGGFDLADGPAPCAKTKYLAVYGSIVTDTATVIPASGQRLVPWGVGYYPKISYANNNIYLVVWEGIAYLAASSAETRIIGARVDTSLNTVNVLDGYGVAIGGYAGSGAFFPNVTWNGEYHQVVWHDYRNDSNLTSFVSGVNSTTNENAFPDLDFDIYGSRVKVSAAEFKQIDPEYGFLLHRSADFPDFNPSVTWNGKEFAVGWTDHMVARWETLSYKMMNFNRSLNISPSELPNAPLGESFSQILSVADCYKPITPANCSASTYTWTIENVDWDIRTDTVNNLTGSGLTLNSITGEISGTPPVIGPDRTYWLRVKATSNLGFSSFRDYRLEVGNPNKVFDDAVFAENLGDPDFQPDCFISTVSYLE